MFGPLGTIGGLVHLVHQGVMKITLFFCAGNYAETLGIHKISEMDGVGRRMPATTAAFSIGALGMMGAPLTAGAISKAWLVDGASAAGMEWAIWVLTASSLLNAAYFLPILWRAWFRPSTGAWPEEHIARRKWHETAWLLLLPPLITGALTLALGTVLRRRHQPADLGPLHCRCRVPDASKVTARPADPLRQACPCRG